MQKYPILLLHGWNLSAEKFSPLVNALKEKGYTAEAIDLPGFGKSKIPSRPYFLSDYVSFVEDYIAPKKWKEVVIIGHSFGGRIAIKLASQKPSFLKALILTGAPGINPVPKIKTLFFLSLAKVGDLLLSLPIINNIRPIARKLLYKAARATDFYNTDENMRDTFENIVNESLIDYMSKIRIPTLLIWGENDLIVPLYIGQRMKNMIEDSKLEIIKEGRHGVPWTHPGKFANLVNRFLDSL